MKLSIYAISLLCLLYLDEHSMPNRIICYSFDDRPKSEKSMKMFTDGGIIINDKKDFRQGVSSWYLTNSPYSSRFKTYIFDYIGITDTSNQIKILIESKSNNLDFAYLKVHCLDIDEKLVKKDSIKITSPGIWQKFAFSIHAPNTKKIYVEIEAKSDDSLSFTNMVKQELWLDNLQLMVDNKKNYPLKPTNSGKVLINKGECLGYVDSKKYHFNQIKDFSKHTIIGLGESVHGSNEIQKIAFGAIKFNIEHNNCKLVLLEIPFELGLRINEFTIGNHLGEIEALLMFYNYNMSELLGFLNWIREYNRKIKNKVIVCGIDNNISNIVGHDNLIELLKGLRIENEHIKAVCELIKKENYSEALTLICKDKIMDKIDYLTVESIKHALQQRTTNYDPKPELLEGSREYVQFVNAKFAISMYSKNSYKTILYAHLGHLNKKNSFGGRIYIPSLGAYLNQYYGNNYFVISLLVGKGSILNINQSGAVSPMPLVLPINGSIEASCLRKDKRIIYQRLNSYKSTEYVRYIGASYTSNQFYPISFKKRFDAFIFIEESSSYAIPYYWPKTKIEFLRYKKLQQNLLE